MVARHGFEAPVPVWESFVADTATGVNAFLPSSFVFQISLRKYRRWIPALIHSTKLNRSNLGAALVQADREVRHQAPIRERVPHRTIMTVRRLEKRAAHTIVKVMMSQWKATLEIGFPLEMVPEKLQPETVAGALLIAQVNIEAICAEDLFFDKFELPDTDVLKKAKSIFDRP